MFLCTAILAQCKITVYST